MLQVTEKPRSIVFHFNKGHLKDPTIPMWVVKMAGNTYYVEHVEFKCIDFPTKETPDNNHTKGSIKCKGYLYIDDNNHALITGEQA